MIALHEEQTEFYELLTQVCGVNESLELIIFSEPADSYI